MLRKLVEPVSMEFHLRGKMRGLVIPREWEPEPCLTASVDALPVPRAREKKWIQTITG